jgi:hypothetical protein
MIPVSPWFPTDRSRDLCAGAIRSSTSLLHARERARTFAGAECYHRRQMKFVRNLLVLVLLVAANTQGQAAGTTSAPTEAAGTFRLKPALPFVYLEFDHVGEGKKGFENEPATRIWLRLVNNCRLPIVLRGELRTDSGVEGEVFLEDVRVVPNPPMFTIVSSAPPIEPNQPPLVTSLAEPTKKDGKKPTQNTPPKAEPPSIPRTDDEGAMPTGYTPGDIVDIETIMPGAEVLFSVPVNFLSKKWHFEIGFDFAAEESERPGETGWSPENSFFADSSVRGEVHMVVAYGLNDLPASYRREVETINAALGNKP